MAARHRPTLETIDGSDKPLVAPLLREAFRWFSETVTAGIAARDIDWQQAKHP